MFGENENYWPLKQVGVFNFILAVSASAIVLGYHSHKYVTQFQTAEYLGESCAGRMEVDVSDAN